MFKIHTMTAIFKSRFSGVDYVFHRTVLNDEIVYFVTFRLNGEHTSVKISSQGTGSWEAQHRLTGNEAKQVNELVYVVAEKERVAY